MIKGLEKYIGLKLKEEKLQAALRQGVHYAGIRLPGNHMAYVYFDTDGRIRNFTGGAAYVTKQDPNDPSKTIHVYEEYDLDTDVILKYLSENTEELE